MPPTVIGHGTCADCGADTLIYKGVTRTLRCRRCSHKRDDRRRWLRTVARQRARRLANVTSK